MTASLEAAIFSVPSLGVNDLAAVFTLDSAHTGVAINEIFHQGVLIFAFPLFCCHRRPPLAVMGVWWIMKSIIDPKCYGYMVVTKNGNQNLCVTVRLYLNILSTYHSTLRLFAKYRKTALTRFHRGLTKCQVEVSCNTDRVNVFNLNTLTWVAAIHPMWSKCPHGVSRNAEGYSGE